MSQPRAQQDAQSQGQDATNPHEQEGGGNRKFHKTRKATRFILAVDAWKRGGAILLHRSSFPLMRQVISSEKRGIQTASQLQLYTAEVLARSVMIHSYLIVVMLPLMAWSFLVTVKGFAAYIRFEELTTWIFYGPVLLIFTGSRIFLSVVSRTAQSKEILRRNRELEA